MPISRSNPCRFIAPLAAAILGLAACSDNPTAPDPLDAESLASRLETLARQGPQSDRFLLSAAGDHFRAVGRVTPITVLVNGQRETWYATGSEVVFPPLPCLPPSQGLSCGGPLGLDLRQMYAVDGLDALRVLVITTSTAGGGEFGVDDLTSPAPRLTTGILLERGTGLSAFAAAGSATSSLVETLGECRRMPRRPGSSAPSIESCERVSMAWAVDATMAPFFTDDPAPAALNIVIPAVEVLGNRVVFGAITMPPR